MKQLLVLGALLAVATAASKSIWSDKLGSGLRVRFDMVGTLGETFFIDIPRTVAGVRALGWSRVPRPSGALLSQLDLFCPDSDYTVCGLYDDLEYISGLQIAVRVAELDSVPMDLLHLGYSLWNAPAHAGSTQQVYWVNSQFFVSEETLKKSREERMALHNMQKTLYDGGVYVPAYGGRDLMKIPIKEADLAHTPYVTQGCIVGMGQHYYYNMTSSADCEAVYPWFTLNSGGELIGTGLLTFGSLADPAPGRTDWFERPARPVVQAIVPNGPECLYDLTDAPGVHTIHIYYIDAPWQVGC